MWIGKHTHPDSSERLHRSHRTHGTAVAKAKLGVAVRVHCSHSNRCLQHTPTATQTGAFSVPLQPLKLAVATVVLHFTRPTCTKPVRGIWIGVPGMPKGKWEVAMLMVGKKDNLVMRFLVKIVVSGGKFWNLEGNCAFSGQKYT